MKMLKAKSEMKKCNKLTDDITNFRELDYYIVKDYGKCTGVEKRINEFLSNSCIYQVQASSMLKEF